MRAPVHKAVAPSRKDSAVSRREFLRAGGLGLAGLLTGSNLLIGCGRRGQTTKNWAWIPSKQVGSRDDWRALFGTMREHGVVGALVRADTEEEARELVPLARGAGVELHSWIIALRCTDEEIKKQHPDWFMVNREGVSCLEKPPYIPAYTWLCPSRKEVQDYLASRVDALAGVDGLAGIHLDYIRYPDVILPVGVQPRYNLVQDREYPEFDYCYCSVCRDLFRKQTGVDPLDLEDPSQSEEWRQFRFDRVTRLVNRLVEVAHARGKQISAAVFPSPTIARRLVRQDWPSWNLDAFHPMMYHKYYNGDIDWIGQVTREGVSSLAGKAPLYSGLFVRWLPPEDLGRAVRVAVQNGAAGVTLFTGTRMTGAQWKALSETLRSLA